METSGSFPCSDVRSGWASQAGCSPGRVKAPRLPFRRAKTDGPRGHGAEGLGLVDAVLSTIAREQAAAIFERRASLAWT